MRTTLIVCSIAILLTSNLSAQKGKFDMVSFTAPAGWQRIDSNGIVLFQQSKTGNGQLHFCQIFLFPSHAGSNNTEQDFNAAWRDRIQQSTGVKTMPKTTVEKTPDGWTQTSGAVNITQQGVTYSCTLLSLTGFGKQMSFVVTRTGADYQDDVLVFFKNLEARAPLVPGDLHTAGGVAPESATTGTGKFSDYGYTAPQGWTMKQYDDGIVLSAPGQGNERCALTLWPVQPAGNDILNDANRIFAAVFKTFENRNDGMTPNTIVRGVSAQGWEYGVVKRSIGERGYGTIFGFVFVAKLGNQLASISGMSKDPMVSNCFGLLGADVWPKFFYSLQFRNWKQTSGVLARQITGDWISATGSASSKFSFAPNGRYGDAAASQYYNRVSGTEVQQTTTAYFGNGAYSITGNRITLTSDQKKNNPETGFIRVEQESIDNGRNWTEKLFLYRTSNVDGKEYEVSYKRNR